MNTNENKKNDNPDILQIVTFNIGNEEFGIEVLSVQEIIRMVAITQVPNSSEIIEGIINLRGHIVPVIDLRVVFGMDRIQYSDHTRIIVVEINKATMGIIVDSVNEVMRIPSDITEAPPSFAGGIDSEFIKAVGKLDNRMLILLNLASIFSFRELAA